MQSKDTNTRTAGAVNHPDQTEWMAFLYEEIAPAKKKQLSEHLASCAACAKQVQMWRGSMKELDQWVLPAMPQKQREWVPVLKWAVAAAVVLCVGFALGRTASPANAELASLKTRLAQLEQNAQRPASLDEAKAVQVATAAANTETLRLLADYARTAEEQRLADRQQVNFVLRAMRNELETVAVNTETSFEQTHENMTRLVALTSPVESTTQQ